MRELLFDIDKMTIEDYVLMVRSAQANDIHGFLSVVNKCASSSIWGMPFSELNAVCGRFTEAFKAYLEVKEDAKVQDAKRMIERLFGEKPE